MTDYAEIYTTLANVKEALSIDMSDLDDDDFLDNLIARSSRQIDRFCNRQFVAISDTREFDAVEDVDGQVLYLDNDLAEVTTVTNGDATTVSGTDYTLLPINYRPAYAIKLKTSASLSWTYTSSPEAAISVLGKWGYATGTPNDIEQACIGLTIYWYKKRKNPFLQVGVAQSGLAVISANIPDDVRDLLSPFVRHSIY